MQEQISQDPGTDYQSYGTGSVYTMQICNKAKISIWHKDLPIFRSGKKHKQ
jgi:hypothetical protein